MKKTKTKKEKIWFELDPKKLGNKSIIYGQHYIETYYIKKNNNMAKMWQYVLALFFLSHIKKPLLF